MYHWNSDSMPAALAYDAWHLQMTGSSVPWQLHRAGDERFLMNFSAAMFETVGVTKSSFSSCSGQRGLKEIQRSDASYYSVQFMMGGQENVSSGSHHSVLTPGDAYIWDSEDEFSFQSLEQVESYSIRIPKSALVGCGVRDGLPVRKLSFESGLPKVLFQTVRSAFSNLHLFSPSEQRSIEETIIALTEGSFAGVSRDAGKASLWDQRFRQIRTYIKANLGDADLSVARVADAQGISRRNLHSLFSERGMTFSGYVLQQRIEMVKKDLLVPHSRTAISVIGHRHGFREASHLSRVFKRVTGMSAREFRSLRE